MRCLIWTFVLAIIFAGLTALLPAPAFASGCPTGTVPAGNDDGAICIPVVDRSNGDVDGGGDSIGGRGTDPTECKYEGKNVPCMHAGGSWSPSNQCYLLPTGQPPASSDQWQGHDPGEGRLYACVRPGFAETPSIIFVPNGEEAPPDPAVLARRALDQLKLTVPEVHLAPSPPAKTYVGLETWLWMPTEQWQTLTKSVSAGATTVAVRAEPRRAAWKMGAGSTICYDSGRVWTVGQMSKSATTSCQYIYERVSDFEPDDRFEVSATITFRADWTCSGNCLADEGSLGNVDGLAGTASIRVGERQSVNTTPGDGR